MLQQIRDMVRDFAQPPGKASRCAISSSTLNEKQAREKGKQLRDIYLQPLKKVKTIESEVEGIYEIFLIFNVYYIHYLQNSNVRKVLLQLPQHVKPLLQRKLKW